MQAPVSLQRVMAFEQRIDPGEFVLSPWRVPMWSVVRSYIAGALYDSIAGTGFQKKGGARVRPGAAFFYRTWAGRHGTSPARQPAVFRKLHEDGIRFVFRRRRLRVYPWHRISA